jgi:hypothetical protein
MTEPPEKPLTSPTHLRPIAVEIPAAWTPEEALAVFELLEELREKIWVRYSIQMQELLEEQQGRFGVNQGNADTAAGDEPTF